MLDLRTSEAEVSRNRTVRGDRPSPVRPIIGNDWMSRKPAIGLHAPDYHYIRASRAHGLSSG